MRLRRRRRPRLQGLCAHRPGAGRRAAGAGVRGNQVLLLQTLEIEENEEQEWRSSSGKKTLAGAEVKSVDCRRFEGPIDEPNALTKPSTRQTQRYPRIPQTRHGLGIIARRSCRRSWNRPELRRTIPGARIEFGENVSCSVTGSTISSRACIYT
jgi:hypothetical protein